ncbi:MAG: extracellular solute-binding protein [Calditrichaeota bacterium]|nr:extracellular solute-binding protein [Calditrichota bacterium]
MRHLFCQKVLLVLVLAIGLGVPLSDGLASKTVLRVANWAGARELKLERRIAAEFMKRHPEVVVSVETIPSGYKEKILTGIASGTPPDVFLLDATIIPAFLNQNVLVDLMPYVKKHGIDLSVYFPNVLKIAERDSSLFALPKDFTPMVMYYNKRLFDAAGLSYPAPGWTWEDYLKLSQKLTKDFDGDGRIDQFGTVVSDRLYLWIPWVWSNGGDVLNPKGTRAAGYFNSPETEQALQFLIDLRTKYHVAPFGSYLTAVGGTGALFYTGKIGMMESGHWWIPTLKKYLDSGKLSIGVAPLPVPKGGRHVTVMYESGWCVPKVSRHREWAVRLAIFLAGEEAARIRSESGIAIPAIRRVAKEQAEEDPYGIEQVFLNDVQYARMPWGSRVEPFSQIETIARDAVDQVMIGHQPLHTTFTRAAEKMDQTLARSKRLRTARLPNTGHATVQTFLWSTLLALLILILVHLLSTRKQERRHLFQGYIFLGPSLIILLVFVAVPLLFSLYLSFHQWNVISPEKPFVGFANFAALFRDALFWKAMKNTALFTLQVPVGMAVALFVAILMNQRLKGIHFFRTIFFLPSVSSFVAVALVWQWLYQPQYGLVNFILKQIGFGPVPWLSSPRTALLSIMIMTVWMGIGYQMVIFLAGLQGIPEYLYEAAIIDGASPWQRFWAVTLPLLKPTTFFVLITSVIGSFQVFTSVYVMTQGGPNRATDVVVYHIYQNAWEYLRMGYASAMSWVLFVVILIATVLQFKVVGKDLNY